MRSSYLLFNKIIAATLAAIIFYFGIYTLFGDYAVQCQVLKATGHPCIGCGLTRGIHQAILFHFDDALKWNPSSLLVLSFLIITILLRGITSFIVLKTTSEKHLRILLIIDLTVSISLYLFCFRHFFTNQILK
ncbi:MAG TPA: DUF2752 domain-containing protein [Bacteroidia bacterium]|nr:DUF2752 domain-containing protein [Bacteroidia bacterium]